MAKSIRSKWKRKCRAFKRIRYGAKELERLKKTLGIDEKGTQEVEMTEISKIATVVDAETIKESAKTNENTEAQGTDTMEVDSGVKRVYNKRTMRDQYGNYPIWMSKRSIAKHKKGRAKSRKGTTRPQKRLTRKQKKQRNKSEVKTTSDN
ncbi:Protein LLP like protein [Habropoda laboriosa]|uniref:Protein LLP like protein n=1 Tax=Habropoda laboriosa TaxID=597456 RepID=A0A0L7QU53_9HYME|nr:PREDICTED: protein LLP homolog [Habropoda laboriosa]KOC62089.1 Protein LLP like protein [Habropoda laboriosa]